MWLLNPYRFGDPDAAAYIAAVEVADGQVLEAAVASAITAFVVGCKTDGIWNAIKASCIMAGARTLAGALVPLKGAAPTNFNFVAGDYDRKTGLKGDGSTKYLDSNRSSAADPQNSQHLAVYHNSTATGVAPVAGMVGLSTTLTGTMLIALPAPFTQSREQTGTAHGGAAVGVGLFGVSRGSSASYTWRASGGAVSGSVTLTSGPPLDVNSYIFARRETNGTPGTPTTSRLPFYSIGEAIDLALLDARVTTLMNALAAAIP